MRFRTFVTPPIPLGTWGDVCPETATLGIGTRHLRKIVTAMSTGVAVTGAQDSPKAFAAERREVPT